jgi:hypothetical protein
MRQLTSAYVRIRRLEGILRLRLVHMCVRIPPNMLLILCYMFGARSNTSLDQQVASTLRQHTSGYVSIRLLRQHTSACCLQDTPHLRLLIYYITLTGHCVSVSVWFKSNGSFWTVWALALSDFG